MFILYSHCDFTYGINNIISKFCIQNFPGKHNFAHLQTESLRDFNPIDNAIVVISYRQLKLNYAL